MTQANFQIIPTGSDYRLEPLTDMACSLAIHCRRHGNNLIYPTLVAAEGARCRMDIAIENRNGRPWATFERR